MLPSTSARRTDAALGTCEFAWLTSFSHRNFSPVPKRVMDGSEPGESVAAAVLSGAPTDLQARTVRYGG